MSDRILHRGRFLRLVDRDGWEFCARAHGPDVVALIAVTDAGELLLTEQFRPPLRGPVLELPAGLVGDEDGGADESVLTAGQRELIEDTGFRAGQLEVVFTGPASAGLTDETIHFVRARDLERVGDGGGVGGEDITLHRIPVHDVARFLDARAEGGVPSDPKVHAALWLLTREQAAGSAQ